MLLQKPLLGEAHVTKDMHDRTDEADETLSLSDLPLYGDQSIEEWEEEDLSTKSSQGSSSVSSSDHDYFEFFSQELSPPTYTGEENIVFCGKLIKFKKLDPSEEDGSNLVENKKPTNKITTTLVNKNGHRHISSSLQKSPNKKMSESNKHEKGYYDFPVHKMSILTTSSSGKARWHLFLFGMSRFSTQVELRDIRSRLNRRQPPTTPPSSPIQDHNKNASGGNKGSGLGRLIRVLSCGVNQHPNAMVVASTSCCSPRA